MPFANTAGDVRPEANTKVGTTAGRTSAPYIIEQVEHERQQPREVQTEDTNASSNLGKLGDKLIFHDTKKTVLPRTLKLARNKRSARTDGGTAKEAKERTHTEAMIPKATMRLKAVVALAIAVTISGIARHMHAGSSDRHPPMWGPTNQSSFPFRDWAWSIASPLDERRKAAAAIQQLRGAAKRLI